MADPIGGRIAYRRGDLVAHAGWLWIAHRTTSAEPTGDSPDWTRAAPDTPEDLAVLACAMLGPLLGAETGTKH